MCKPSQWFGLFTAFMFAGMLSVNAQDDFEVPGLGFGRGRPPAVNVEPMPPAPVGEEPLSPPIDKEPLPEDAQALVDALDKEAAEIRRKAEQEIAARREKTVKALKELQDKYTRDAKLDEAVAIRDTIRKLSVAHLKTAKNPGNLSAYARRVDHSFLFDVTGAAGGSVWGTEVYTCDSSLSAAAVHAGVLKVGERGIVKVTIVPSPPSHTGSVANGIRSSSWGTFAASYIVERPESIANEKGLPAATPLEPSAPAGLPR